MITRSNIPLRTNFASASMKLVGFLLVFSTPADAAAAEECSYEVTDNTGLSLVCLDEAALDAHAEAETLFEQALMLNADTEDLEAAFGDATNDALIGRDQDWFDTTATSCRSEMLDLTPGDAQQNAYSRCIEAAVNQRQATLLQEINRIRRTK